MVSVFGCRIKTSWTEVDSHVYIDLLRSRRDAMNVLYQWAGERNLVVCGMIRLEVLRGVKSIKVLTRLSAFMDVMCNVPTHQSLWQDATDLAWALDRRGSGSGAE